MEVACKNCEKIFNKKAHEVKKFPNHFCSRRCAITFNNKVKPKRTREIKVCENCCAELPETAQKFCNTACSSSFKKNKLIQDWLQGKRLGIKVIMR